MPKGVPLSDKQKQQIYTRYVINGDRQREIAEDFGISSNTVSKVIAEIRKAGDKMAAHSKIVAGDKANGRLQSTTDPHRFEGTCVIGGKKHSKTFTTVNARKATEMWEKWCRDLRDEAEFMDMVERKPKEDGFVPTDEPMAFDDFLEDEPKAVCGYPGDPIEEIRPIQVIEPAPVPEINVRPWREVAEERQQRIEELEAKVAELEANEPLRSDWVIERTEYEKPILEHWFNNNGAFRVFWMNKPVYVLWAKSDTPKIYGVYRTMEAALKEVDRLNEVASFLGSEGAFEVEEVAWKS